MSAIIYTCPDCGHKYMSGMVGDRPWPAHACRIPSNVATPLVLMQNPKATIEFTESQQEQIRAIVAQRKPPPGTPAPLDDD